jgi:hypothetical protein
MVPPLQTLAEQPQVLSVPHFTPQPPQLAASEAVADSQPLAPDLSQSLVPAGHDVHALELQN